MARHDDYIAHARKASLASPWHASSIQKEFTEKLSRDALALQEAKMTNLSIAHFEFSQGSLTATLQWSDSIGTLHTSSFESPWIIDDAIGVFARKTAMAIMGKTAYCDRLAKQFLRNLAILEAQLVSDGHVNPPEGWALPPARRLKI